MKLQQLYEVKKSALDVPTLSVGDLAKKLDVPLEELKKALAAGIKVELEHTTDKGVAKEIALDHLAEDPKYYEKLKKVEG